MKLIMGGKKFSKLKRAPYTMMSYKKKIPCVTSFSRHLKIEHGQCTAHSDREGLFVVHFDDFK